MDVGSRSNKSPSSTFIFIMFCFTFHSSDKISKREHNLKGEKFTFSNLDLKVSTHIQGSIAFRIRARYNSIQLEQCHHKVAYFMVRKKQRHGRRVEDKEHLYKPCNHRSMLPNKASPSRISTSS